jgi:hypothetical protein
VVTGEQYFIAVDSARAATEVREEGNEFLVVACVRGPTRRQICMENAEGPPCARLAVNFRSQDATIIVVDVSDANSRR